MSFRVRLTLLCVLAVAVTVVLASVVSYFAVSNRLHDQTDNSLRADATRLAKLPNTEIALPYFNLPTPNARDYLRVTAADGSSKIPPNQPIAIPLRRVDVAIARGDVRFAFDVDVRMLPCPNKPRRASSATVTRRNWLP